MRKVVSNIPSVFMSLSQAPSAKVSGDRTGARACSEPTASLVSRSQTHVMGVLKHFKVLNRDELPLVQPPSFNSDAFHGFTTPSNLGFINPESPFKFYNPSTPVPFHNRSSKRQKDNEPLKFNIIPSSSFNLAERPSKKRKTTRD